MASSALKMMIRIVWQAVAGTMLALCATNGLATAQSSKFEIDGNQLLERCTARQTDQRSSVYSGACYGFIVGVMATIALYQDVLGTTPRIICIPEGIQQKQAVDLVVQYLNAHAKDRHLDAGQLVWLAFLEAYPCKKK